MITKGERLENNKDSYLINWNLMAEPQKDQYDSLVTLEFAKMKYEYILEEFEPEPTFLAGKVAIRNDSAFSEPEFIPAPHNHPNIKKSSQLLTLWPEIFTQCQLLIKTVSPFINTQIPFNLTNGSTCGPGMKGFGAIAATINSYVGFAEALVHEMAHHKLRALGVEFELAEKIIKNSPEQRYKSPIRYDSLRPMSAVLHAQYSYTYVSALDLEIIKAGQDLARDYSIAESSLSVILPKLEFGYKVIKDNAEVDSAGADFLEGYFTWLEQIIKDGYKILDEFQIPPKTFLHPLDAEINTSQIQKSPAVDNQKVNMLINLMNTNLNDKPGDIFNDLSEVTCKYFGKLNGIEEYALGDEMLLYVPETEKRFSLNKSSRFIWELCDGKQTLIEINQKIGQSLGISKRELLEQLLEDVKATIDEFSKLGILEVNNVPKSTSD
jgi:hypothetical protein